MLPDCCSLAAPPAATIPPMNFRRDTPCFDFTRTSLLRLLVALQVFDVLVIFLARIGHDAVRGVSPRERPGYRPRLRKEHRVVVGDGVLQVVLVELLDALDQVQLTAVLVACSVEPAALVDPNGIDDQRVAFPMADGMSHELRVIHDL